MIRRKFLYLSGFALASLPLISTSFKVRDRKLPMIIDADTANEIDDLFAITRALLEPGFEIQGLCSAQWFHHLSPVKTAQESQRLNEDILRLMDRQDIPHPAGAEMIVGKPWGGEEPRDSPAAQLIIKKAREMKDGEKLYIVSLGAVTNAASAILLDPEIIPKISLYCLSGKYYPGNKVWDKDEFNARRDLNALNVVFNTKGLELHVMPVNILYDFKFNQQEMINRLSGKGGIWDYLVARWLSNAPGDEARIFWDLALIAALAHPELAEERSVATPPENTNRIINVYSAIDVEQMTADWWNIVEKAMK